MKKKILQGLALSAAGAVTASTVLSPTTVNVIADAGEEVSEQNKEEQGEGTQSETKETPAPVVPDLKDINVLASASISTVEIDGVLYVKDAPSLSLATVCSAEGISLKKVTLKGTSGEELYSYAGGNTTVQLPEITKEKTNGKTVGECLTLSFELSDGTVLNAPLSEYVSNLNIPGYIIDSDAPVIDTSVSFNGTSKANNGVNYYTSDGTFKISAKDAESGIDVSKWLVEGVSDFSVSSDGNSISFSSEELKECSNQIFVSVTDNVGNVSKSSFDLFMFREPVEVEGVSHSDVYSSSDKIFVGEEGFSLKLKGSKNKVSLYQLLADNTVVSENSEGTLSTNVKATTYTLSITDVKGDKVNYNLGEVFSDLSLPIVIDDMAPEVDFREFTGDTVDVNSTLYFTNNGTVSFNVSDALSGVKETSIEGVDANIVSMENGVVSFPTNSLSEGRHDITVKVEDNVGNTYELPYSFVLYREAPVVSGVSHSNMFVKDDICYSGDNSVSLSIEYDTSKVTKVELYKDAALVGEIDNDIIISDNGDYTIKVYGSIGDTYEYTLKELFSELGNSVVFDSDIPVINKPVYDGNDVTVDNVVYYTEEGSITISASDATSGIDGASWSVDGADINGRFSVSQDGNSITIPTTALPEGKSDFTVYVQDNVGHKTSIPVSVNMYRESSGLEGVSHTDVLLSNNNSYTQNKIDVSIGITDESKVKKVELLKDGEVIEDITDGNFSISETGVYTLRVTGLINEEKDYNLEDLFTDLTSNVYFDFDAPEVRNILFDGDMKTVEGVTYYVSDGNLVITAEDSLSGIDGDSWYVSRVSELTDKITVSSDGNTLTIPTSILPEGETPLSIHVADKLGNKTQFSLSPYMHRTSPEITGTSHTGDATLINGVVYSTGEFSLVVDGLDSEKVKKAELLKDGKVIEEFNEDTVKVPAESGEYTIRVTDIVDDYVDYTLDQLYDDFDSTVVIDTVSPDVKEFSFSGNSVTVEDTEYYTSNGTVSISLEDENSGIDISTVNLTGIKDFNVSADGSMVSFTTDDLDDGITKFSVSAKDNLGNALSKDYSIFMHRTFPEISGDNHTKVVNQDDISYSNQDIQVSLKGYDSYKIDKIALIKDGEVLSEVEDGKFTISQSGEYVVKVTDIVGNIENYRLEDLFEDLYSSITVDVTDPKAAITVNGEDVSEEWVTEKAIVKVNLSDEVALTDALITVNGKEFKSTFNSTKEESITIDLSKDVPRASDGKYKIDVIVKDLSGNESTALSRTVKADFDKPVLTNLKANGHYVEDEGVVYIRDTISISGDTPDVGSGIDRVELLNGSDIVAEGLPLNISESGTYKVRVYDVSGLYTDIRVNEFLGTESNTIVADNTYPLVQRVSGFNPDLVLGEGTFWYNHCPDLSFSITDDNIKRVSIKVNGEERVDELSNDGTYNIKTDGLEGKVNVEVEAVDRIGFTTKDSYNFYIDTTAPENIVGVIDKESIIKSGTAFFKEQPSIAVSANDSGVGLDKYILSGDKNEENTSGQFELGTGTFYLEVQDKLGNSTGKLPVSEVIGLDSNTFVVDEEAPVIDTSRPSGDVNGWFSEDVNYIINVSDDIGLDEATVTINGEVVDEFSTESLGKTSAKLNADTSKVDADSNGMYHVQISVKDNAGNISTWEDSIYIDRTAPTVDRFVFTGNGYREGVESGGSNRYGFFFDGSASCSIHVSDGQISSGMDKLYVTLENINGDEDTQVVDISSGVATVTIPDNFKGFISAYAVDKVGNEGDTNAPDGVVTEDSNCHINNISMSMELPDTPYTDISGNPLYNGDVNIQALIGCDMSGLRNVSWGIGENTIGTVNVDENGNLSGDSGVISSTDKNLVLRLSKVLAAQGNSNGMNIWVTATDRTGHTSETSRVISIDKDAPVISVSYDNTEADGYYNATRTATITVEERNFDPNQFTFSGDYGTLGTWRNDGNTWTNTITFSEDGDYQFSLGCTDRAGNKAEGYSSEKFTIDKTAPVMSVSWNNDNPSNGNYYNTQRTATITVVEHNFDGSLINLIGDGSISGWSSNGDTHTATVSFPQDGEYHFTLSGQDLAGNACENYDSGDFIIDTTTPILNIDGVQASISYKEDVGFTVDVEDKYIDIANTSVELVGRKNGALRVSGSSSGTSGHYSFASMPREEMYDDVYTLNAKVTDMAGNVNEETLVFSVNRFGSKYTFLDASMLNTYLNAPRDVVIEETNVDKLDTSKARVSVIRDGNEIDVDKDLISVVESGGQSDKYNYTYTVAKEAFDKDGKYLVQVFSHALEGTDYSSVSEEYAFVLDTQKPEIIISGVESGDRYRAYDKTVTIDVRDMSGVKDIKAELNGKKVNLNKKDDVYSFTVSESEDLQNIFVEVTDLAGNTSTSSVEDFLITSNAWLFIINQTWFKLGIAAGAALLTAIIALIIKNRRDAKREEEASLKEHEELYRTTSSSSSGVASTSSTGKDMVEDLEQSEDVSGESTTEENITENN